MVTRIRRSRPQDGASFSSDARNVPSDSYTSVAADPDTPLLSERLQQGAIIEFNHPSRPSREYCISRLPEAPPEVYREWTRLGPESRLRSLFTYFMDCLVEEFVDTCRSQSLDVAYSVGTMRRLAVEYGRADIQWDGRLALFLRIRGVISIDEMTEIVNHGVQPTSIALGDARRQDTVRYVAAWGERPPWVREIETGTFRGQWTWNAGASLGPTLWHNPADPTGRPVSDLFGLMPNPEPPAMDPVPAHLRPAQGWPKTRRERPKKAPPEPPPRDRLWRFFAKKNP